MRLLHEIILSVFAFVLHKQFLWL